MFYSQLRRHGTTRGHRGVRPGAALLAGASGAIAVLGMIAGPAVQAGATAGVSYFVAQTGVSAAADTGCNTAAYDSIQAAVTAAEGYESAHHGVVPAIEVCPGTYSEQVTISSSLAINRANVPASRGPVVIELPAAVGSSQSAGLSTTNCQAKDAATNTQVPQSVVEICAAKPGGGNTKGVSVAVSHVTIEGDWPSSVCYDSLYGVLVEGGANLSLTSSVVQQAGAYPLNGCQGGVGIQAGLSVTGQIGHASLTRDTVQSYQKNGITIDGPGSTGRISDVTISGAGPTAQIAQNGVQISFGATGTVTGSTITGNNYTGTGEASATGILVVGGGGAVCGIGKDSPLVQHASFTRNALINNDLGIALFNVNSACNKSVHMPTRDVACYNAISNSHGYAGGPSADANISGLITKKYGAIGDQAGVSDTGADDVICRNAISGVGYAPRDSRRTLPNPKPPAWVRPVDIYSFAAAWRPVVNGNTYDGKQYRPR